MNSKTSNHTGAAARFDTLSSLVRDITGLVSPDVAGLSTGLAQIGFDFSVEELSRMIQNQTRMYGRLQDQLVRVRDASDDRAKTAEGYIAALCSNKDLVASLSRLSQPPIEHPDTVARLVAASEPFLPADVAPRGGKRQLGSIAVGGVSLLDILERGVAPPAPAEPDALSGPAAGTTGALLVERLKELAEAARVTEATLGTLEPFVSATRSPGRGEPVTDSACDTLSSLHGSVSHVLDVARASETNLAVREATEEAQNVWRGIKEGTGTRWGDMGRLAELLE